MRLKKSIVNIGKSLCTVVQFNYTPPKDKNISVVEIRSPLNSILYLNRRTLKIEKDILKVNLSATSANKFYIIGSSCEEFLFEINEEGHDSSGIKSKLTERDTENLLYAIAYEEYCKGNTSGALDILKFSLRDRYLSRAVLSAFTSKERQRCSDILLSAVRNVKINIRPKLWGEARLMEGQLNEGEILEDGPCFMDLLEIFEKNGDKFIPVSSEKYRRIGNRVVDCYNAFKIDKTHKLTAEFRNLIFTKEKLNISIRYEIPGFVIINPRQAKSAGLKTNSFSAKVYREQTIIKDGEINIDKFQALVSKKTLKYLESLSIKDLFKKSEKNEYPYEGFSLIEMNISKLPVLNRKNVSRSDSLDYILDTIYEQRCAECKQKVLKYFLDKNKLNSACEKLYFTRKQRELLQSFGLTPDGIYHGIDNRVVIESKDTCESRFFEFGIKGFSIIPKVEDVTKKMDEDGRKLNGPETVMANAIKYIRKTGIETRVAELNKLLDKQKEIIRINTRTLAVIKLAKVLSGGWWTGLKLNSKENYLYEREDNTLVIRMVRKTVQI